MSASNHLGFRFWRWASFSLAALLVIGACFLGRAGGSSVAARRFQRLDFSPAIANPGSPAHPARFIFSFTGKVGAQVRKEIGIPLIYLDILGGRVDLSPVVMPFASGPARLVRLSQISENPPVVRATFFLRQLAAPKIRVLADSVEVLFAGGEAARDIGQAMATRPAPFALLNPAHEPPARPRAPSSEMAGTSLAPENAPVPEAATTQPPLTLDLKGVTATSLLQELAKQAGMSIHFRDAFDVTMDVKEVASNPLDAMALVLARLGGALSIEDGEIWVSMQDNPLLRFSDQDVVERADLRDLSLGDVLRALGQMGELNIVLDRSLDGSKERPVDMYLTRMTYRRAFETILRTHELTVRAIDSRTLLVMTEKAARQVVGKTVRVIPIQVPFAKIEEIAKKTLAPTTLERVTIQEDLGNVVLVGDKEEVDQLETLVTSLEGKLKRSGEALRREYFAPVNTKAEDLIKLVNETLGEKNNLKLVRDERTETLVVTGPADTVERALGIMRELDRSPTRQALVHIRLAEVKRSDLENLGLNVKASAVSVANLARMPTAFEVPADFADTRNRSRIRTLANPTLRCMDKEEASIDISEQIPVKNTVTEYLPVASASLAARTTDQWTTSDIGIKLKVKPYISNDNEVTMEVNVDLTELVQMVEGHPWTAKRNINTRVRVKDGETVVIGGLIRRKNSGYRKPLPILSRIPLFKKLLRGIEYRTREEEETEMIILITPRVVGSTSGFEADRRKAAALAQENLTPGVQVTQSPNRERTE